MSTNCWPQIPQWEKRDLAQKLRHKIRMTQDWINNLNTVSYNGVPVSEWGTNQPPTRHSSSLSGSLMTVLSTSCITIHSHYWNCALDSCTMQVLARLDLDCMRVCFWLMYVPCLSSRRRSLWKIMFIACIALCMTVKLWVVVCYFSLLIWCT